ncbi:MAG: ArsR family transcriptional regulator [Bacteroidetes bacterium]|nr:ArsR family transcriptional regulator [Bacteroidota bacterium]
MLESLITSKTRIKLLLKFFLNSNNSAHLRGLESEFGESTNGIRLELNRFETAGLLCSHSEGNRKVYSANVNHPLFIDIQRIVHKHLGIDQLVEQVALRIGELESVFLTGAFARGQESSFLELVFVGKKVDREYLEMLINKASLFIKREIHFRLIDSDEKESILQSAGKEKFLLLWQQNN